MTTVVARKGTLYIVATPIGNRDDISLRALKILASVDLIIAEDTRHSRALLTNLGIKNKLSAFHAHNELEKSAQIIDLLTAGQSIALISDAGTPLISDPGFPLVKMARQQQISVVPIPGASALITALSAAGIACDAFTFIGFLPAKQEARQKRLYEIQTIEHTLICYESTHRIMACIQDIMKVFGAECHLVLAKELTKTFETFITGTSAFINEWLQEDPARCKGEFVLLISPRLAPKIAPPHEKILTALLAELPLNQAVKIATKITTLSKNELYKLALSLQK